MDDPSESEDPAFAVEVIRDQVTDDCAVSIATYDTIAAYERAERCDAADAFQAEDAEAVD
jgi:hypothetical protein